MEESFMERGQEFVSDLIGENVEFSPEGFQAIGQEFVSESVGGDVDFTSLPSYAQNEFFGVENNGEDDLTNVSSQAGNNVPDFVFDFAPEGFNFGSGGVEFEFAGGQLSLVSGGEMTELANFNVPGFVLDALA